jgi:drug/metabolite transporter (DMT)-like permease
VSPRAWAGFAAITFLWGIPYLFIKIAVDDGIPPAFVAWSRVVLGAAVVLPLAWHAGTLGQLGGSWRWVVVFALIEVAIPWPLLAAGEQHVDSSLAAILIATAPLIVALIALRFDHSERVGGRRLAGLLIGFIGVVVLVGVDVAGDSDELLGAGLILFVAACYAVGPMVLRRQLPAIDSRATMGASLAVAAVVLTPLAIVDPPAEAPSGDGLISLFVLGLLCTAAALVIYGPLVIEIGAGRALVITYVAPVVALGLGIAVLGESPGTGAIAGLLLILAGSWLSTDGRLPPGLESLSRRRRRGARRRPARSSSADPPRARPPAPS